MLTVVFKKRFTLVLWFIGLLPLLLTFGLLVMQTEDKLPPVSMLDNPPELQASLILGQMGDTIGRLWKVNRTNAEYRDISPFVFDALGESIVKS